MLGGGVPCFLVAVVPGRGGPMVVLLAQFGHPGDEVGGGHLESFNGWAEVVSWDIGCVGTVVGEVGRQAWPFGG